MRYGDLSTKLMLTLCALPSVWGGGFPRVSMVTLSNAGYVTYTANLIFTLQHFAGPVFECMLEVACIDDECVEALSPLRPSCPDQVYRRGLIDFEAGMSEFSSYKSKSFNKITHLKFELLAERLLTHDFVLLIDGDVVIRDPRFLKLTLDAFNGGDDDVVGMCDSGHTELICNHLKEFYGDGIMNTGYAMFASNARTREIFTPGWTSSLPSWVEDQEFFNREFLL